MTSMKEKLKAVQQAVSAIEKAVRQGRDHGASATPRNPRSPSRSMPDRRAVALDIALGIGGYPRGRVIEIFGPESSGKTTLTLHAIAEVQRQGGVAAFIDAEHALDVSLRRRSSGVEHRGAPRVAARPRRAGARDRRHARAQRRGRSRSSSTRSPRWSPRPRSRARWATQHVGLQARLMSQALRKLTGDGPQVEHDAVLHQPDPDEDRRDVRLARDHDRRQRAEVLRVACASTSGAVGTR
jgi:recombination protein RecA